MKILHTSDWHLGKKLDAFSRLDEQTEVMAEITAIADVQNVDVIVVAGDLFDNANPSAEAIELLYRTLKKLSDNGKRPVIAIAGNHDNPERIEAPDPLARECAIFFFGFPNTEIPSLFKNDYFEITKKDKGFIEIKLEKYPYPLRILTTPYASSSRLFKCFDSNNKEQEFRSFLKEHWEKLAESYCDNKGVNILLTHLFIYGNESELPEEPDDAKPILHPGGVELVLTDCIPQSIQYTALGHLHRFQNVGSENQPIVYSGSPLAYSFSEAAQQKYVAVVDLEPNSTAKIQKIQLEKGRRLYRATFDEIGDAIEWMKKHSEDFVEVSFRKTYLTAEEKSLLYEAHERLVRIGLEAVDNNTNYETVETFADLTQDINTLFKDYFKSRYGAEPDEEIMGIFKEILSLKD